MQRRVFLIHGWEGRPDNHWFPWLSWELKARGFAVHALTMPHSEAPKVSEWIGAIKAAVGRPTAATYFVGHSIGCQAILRYLESLPEKAKIGGAIFVAGWLDLANLETPEEKEIAKPWIETPIDFKKAKSHCPKFTTIFSDNDKYAPMARSLEFQKALGAKAVLERGKGHFTKDEGVVALPSVFKSLMAISPS